MAKIIALQANSQKLVDLLQQQGYTVIDMYQAHQQRELVDAYLYTTYHPNALATYHSVAQPTDSILNAKEEMYPFPATLMMNVTNLPPEQVLIILEQRLQEN
ncbi:MAG: hypothetical protein K0R78_3169 [Pelosinus sp.]|jgi:hypothetical protein|nr:hypothetical protein [Pelosinus sp.]